MNQSAYAISTVGSTTMRESREDTRGSPVYVIGRGSTGGIALYAASLDERIAAVAVDRWLATFSDLVTTRDYIWHFMDFLPRVLAFHDLPQVVGSLAPRPVYLLDSLDAEKRRLRTGEVIERYGWAKACYQLLDQRRSLTIGSSQGPEDTESLLLQWVNDVTER